VDADEIEGVISGKGQMSAMSGDWLLFILSVCIASDRIAIGPSAAKASSTWRETADIV
jgi:hypothetical protein